MREKWFKLADALSAFGMYGLIFFIPISKAMIESFFGVMLLGVIIKKFARPEFSSLKSRLNLYLFLFIGFCGLSLLNSGQFFLKSLDSLLYKWLEYVGIFLCLQDIMYTRKRIKACVAIFICVSALIVADGLIQKFTGVDFIRHKQIVEIAALKTRAITASFNHYNDFGAYLVVILSLIFALQISGWLNKTQMFIFPLLGLLLFSSLIFTCSRGSWLGFVFSFILMFFLTGNKKRIIFVVLLLAGLAIIMPEVKKRILFTFSSSGDADRFVVWQATLSMIRENPFLGKGLGTFMDYFHKYLPTLYIQYAHNSYLQIWAETGVFSLVSFLAFLYSVLSSGLRLFTSNKDYLALGLACGLSGFLLHAFFDTHFYSLQLSAFFWVIAGLIVSLVRLKPSSASAAL